jgi:hypothetical protein
LKEIKHPGNENYEQSIDLEMFETQVARAYGNYKFRERRNGSHAPWIKVARF